MKKLILPLLALACTEPGPVTVPPSGGYCVESFDWAYQLDAEGYREVTLAKVRDDYVLRFLPDSVATGTGNVEVAFDIFFGADRDTIVQVVLWPFASRYSQRADTVVFQTTEIWLGRSDVVTTRGANGMVTLIDEVFSGGFVYLRLQWRPC